MNRDDREAFDGAIDELRALGPQALELASTMLTQHGVHVAQAGQDVTGRAMLYAARLLYVLAHETIEESLG